MGHIIYINTNKEEIKVDYNDNVKEIVLIHESIEQIIEFVGLNKLKELYLIENNKSIPPFM